MTVNSNKRACEIIYDLLKEKIANGELKPGDHLPSEKKLVELTQRSRPTVREALRMLERSGYIYTIPGSSGAIVKEPNSQGVEQTVKDVMDLGHVSMHELNEYRIISEVATVRWAALRCTIEDADAMKDVLFEMEKNIDDYMRFNELDPKFHGLIAHTAKNQFSVMMNQTFSSIKREHVLGKIEKMPHEEIVAMNRKILAMHTGIYKAIISKDPDKAAERMIEHLQAFEKDLQLD